MKNHEPALVVLAGGKSERMGQPKGLIAVDGRPLLRWQLERFLGGSSGAAFVVVGAAADAYAAAWEEIKTVLDERVSIVRNERFERGPFSSLQCGLRVALAAAGERAVFVLPVDVPAADARTWAALADGLKDGVSAVVPQLASGRGGHPVLLAAGFARRLTELDPLRDDARLDRQLQKLQGAELLRVAVDDERVGMDLNTPQDVARWLARRRP